MEWNTQAINTIRISWNSNPSPQTQKQKIFQIMIFLNLLSIQSISPRNRRYLRVQSPIKKDQGSRRNHKKTNHQESTNKVNQVKIWKRGISNQLSLVAKIDQKRKNLMGNHYSFCFKRLWRKPLSCLTSLPEEKYQKSTSIIGFHNFSCISWENPYKK